jgi:hypothetical protein
VPKAIYSGFRFSRESKEVCFLSVTLCRRGESVTTLASLGRDPASYRPRRYTPAFDSPAKAKKFAFSPLLCAGGENRSQLSLRSVATPPRIAQGDILRLSILPRKQRSLLSLRYFVPEGRIGHNSRFARSRPRLVSPKAIYSGFRFSRESKEVCFLSVTLCRRGESVTTLASLGRDPASYRPRRYTPAFDSPAKAKKFAFSPLLCAGGENRSQLSLRSVATPPRIAQGDILRLSILPRKQRSLLSLRYFVPEGRIELPLPKEHDFESCASTNSATPAISIQSYFTLIWDFYQFWWRPNKYI